MISRRRLLAAMGCVLVPLPAHAQERWGVVRELSGEATVNGYAATRQSALRSGQTLRTGPDGRIWFTIGNDAYFLRPNSRLHLDTSSGSEPFVNFLRLVTGALGATFQRGNARTVTTPTSTIGIRGTGVYVEAAREFTYACICFGETEISALSTGATAYSASVSTNGHEARLVRLGMPIARVGFERHTNEEMAALEALVGRPNPFRS